MSTESLNRTSDIIETPSQSSEIARVDVDVLRQNNKLINRKKICINNLNKRLHLAQKKDKYKNVAIISAIFISVGLVGFIAG